MDNYHHKLESGQVVPHEKDYFSASLTRVSPYKGHSDWVKLISRPICYVLSPKIYFVAQWLHAQFWLGPNPSQGLPYLKSIPNTYNPSCHQLDTFMTIVEPMVLGTSVP
jgi:hypothetical protein